MGQKLSERLSEKDHESHDTSDGSAETVVTDQDNGSFARPESFGGISGISVSRPLTGHRAEPTVTSARTDTQTGQPIGPLCQQEHRPNTKEKQVGGDWRSRTVTGAARGSNPVQTQSRAEIRQVQQKQQESRGNAVVVSRTTAMEEPGIGLKSETSSRFGAETKTKDPCVHVTQDDFVVLEKDQPWTSSDGENESDNRRRTENLRSLTERRIKEDTSAACDDENLQTTFRKEPQDNAPWRQRRRTATTGSAMNDGVGARAGGSPTACSQSERVRHLAEVTAGSRCQLKAAVHAKTTGRGEPDGERTVNGRSMEEVSSQQGKSNVDLENRLYHEVSSDPQTREGLEILGQKPQVDPLCLNRFAGAVSKRAKAGINSSIKRESEQEAESQSTCNRTEVPDNSLSVSESCDENIQTVGLNNPSDSVVKPQPSAQLMPEEDTATDSESVPREQARVKGPPPPVPKKPKNPLIKLRTAKLQSTEVHRRSREQQRSEEKAKRRHTFHFNKDFPWNASTNQDMCTLWDERGPCIAPADVRRLSGDINRRLSLQRMDDKFATMIDYDYCERMAQLSPDKEFENLDMLQRRIFFERRCRGQNLTPAVTKNPQTPDTSTETPSDVKTQRPKPTALEKRDANSESLAEKVCRNARADVTQRSSDKDPGFSDDMDSYKPVAEIVRKTNQTQKPQGRAKPEGVGTEVRGPEQGSSVKVSQMKSTFDVQKKSKERPPAVQPPPKKGKLKNCTPPPPVWVGSQETQAPVKEKHLYKQEKKAFRLIKKS